MLAKRSFGLWHAATIGAVSGALLPAIVGASFLLYSHRGKEFWGFIWDNPQLWVFYLGNYFVSPAIVGGLAGSVVGWALFVTLTPQRVGAFALVSAGALLGAMVGILLAAGAIAGLSISGSFSVGRDGSGGGGVFLIMLGMVVSASVIGSIMGAVVGAIKARRQKQRWEAGRAEPSAPADGGRDPGSS
jgi:hypothetical protein